MRYFLEIKEKIIKIIGKIDKKALFILFLILILGGFLRTYKLGNQSFIGDEYYGLNASYGYYKSGEWKDWNFNKNELTTRVYKRSQAYYWQVAQVFKILDATEATSRLVSVFWGLFGIVSVFVITFLITKNYYISALSSFLLAVSISSLIYDRKLRMYSMFTPVFLWFSYSLFWLIESHYKGGYLFVRKISKKIGFNLAFLPVVIFLGILSLNVHILTVNIIPVVFVYFTIMGLISFRKNRKIFNKYSYLLLVGVLAVFIATKTQEIQNALSFFSWNINNWGYFKIITLDYKGIMLPAVFFVIGAYYLIKKNNLKSGVWTVSSYLVILFLAIMVWRREPGNQYILFTQSFKIIIVSSGIFYVSKTISEKVFVGSRKWFFGLVVLFLILILNIPFFYSKDSFYGEIKSWNYSNYREIFQYFLNNRNENSVLIIRDVPSNTYYLKNTNTNLINYNEKEGNELTLEMILDAQNKYNEVWVIYSRDFYIKREALNYVKEEFKKVENSYANKQLEIWRWKKIK